MKVQAYVPVYSTTLLLSALLLFSVQPLFGKMILPLLGGTPSVWNTAMLFFQVMLLAGYAYAHATSHRLGVRAQAAVHVALLLICMAALPLAVPEGWNPPETGDPVLWQLGLMAVAVGGPFFVLAGTAPMLQRWFTATDHPDSGNPYFLYAASNLGSMSALLAYPVAIEPVLTLHDQSAVWSAGYLALIVMIALSAALVWRAREKAPAAARLSEGESAQPETISWTRRGLWLLLSFIPSSLMLGVTTHVTTDIASAPLLWILPLALYVGTFILTFARRQILSYRAILLLQAAFFICVVFLTITGYRGDNMLLAGLHIGLFAFTALACHTDLARLRPHAGHLTEFYLIMSLGGALGGVFNALIAPRLFLLPLEYVLALALGCFVRHISDEKFSARAAWRGLKDEYAAGGPEALFRRYLPLLIIIGLTVANLCVEYLPLGVITGIIMPVAIATQFRTRWAFGIAAAAALTLLTYRTWDLDSHVVRWHRNFFGITRITDSDTSPIRVMTHGTTIHGAQPRLKEYELLPLTYYHPETPAGDIFFLLDQRPPGPQAVAGLGLGVGSISCYTRPERRFDFYEIDPDVAAMAQNPDYFTYLSKCASPYSITIGDGRLKIEKAPDRSYDLIFLDVFSSDNIPVHVMTVEAFKTYRAKLKDDGIILMNISNRYLDLLPVVAAAAKEAGLDSLFKTTPSGVIVGADIWYAAAIYAAFAKDPDILAPVAVIDGWGDYKGKPARAWTDDYANIVGALRVLKDTPPQKEIDAAGNAGTESSPAQAQTP